MSLVQLEAPIGAAGVQELRALVPAARQGEERASSELLVQVHRIAHRYARARLGTYPSAIEVSDDVAQEVCLGVLRALPRYEERGLPFEAFVYRIAARKVADAQRAFAHGPVTVDHAASDLFDEPVDSHEHDVVARDEASRAWVLMESLPPRQREVLVLRVAVGMSAQETADALGMTAVSVRVTQMRALRELRRRWAEGSPR
ncbi:sigma-70 family RNA polymerase sigma factor [Ornithinimicrobium tianjinense]|uniref:RNA polymerase sigma-D factor n=1 Tax=Ornithinimicrobium tianjinense TaxID=1195761 RepID=A0A917F7R9_9MICO|nr:sigma-70 family RNA polymerase sigma factor [Ornithinimicrobium tianjinense]GGF51750.1 putative RNA polymerase sigma-D factor [Ornithinimicrobium tianjinense]